LCSGAIFPVRFWNCQGGSAKMVPYLRPLTNVLRSSATSSTSTGGIIMPNPTSCRLYGDWNIAQSSSSRRSTCATSSASSTSSAASTASTTSSEYKRSDQRHGLHQKTYAQAQYSKGGTLGNLRTSLRFDRAELQSRRKRSIINRALAPEGILKTCVEFS